MNMIINVIGMVLLGLFAAYIIRGKSRARRINDYFCNAVRVYALTNSDDSRIAIITSAKIAAKRQRSSMIKYLQRMVTEIKKKYENDTELKHDTDNFVQSSIELVEEISSQEWTISEINKQKEELGKVNSEYLVALEKADPTIFAKKHPQLFK